jgi:GntR family transcriptional regulator/MocR family aminotransferase
VIYLGTFSKTMFPAIRTGYMVVPPNLVEPLRSVLARTAPHGRGADQLALAGFLGSGQFGSICGACAGSTAAGATC